MSVRWTFLFVFALGALAAWAEDMFTTTGETYTNVIILRYDRKGYFIRHAGGDTKIPYRAVLPELRDYYKKKASYLTPGQKGVDETEEPPGPDDLATRTGRIYRDVVVREVDRYAVYISHVGGSAKVYFSDIPDKDVRDKYRNATPVEPERPPGTNDLVAVDGQVFRNVEIRLVEPDSLTFRHDGGVSKLSFPSLSEEIREKYGYDPKAAAKYRRDLADEKKRQEEEEAVRRAMSKFEPQKQAQGVDEPINVFDVEASRSDAGEFRVKFAVKNFTDQLLIIRAIPYGPKSKALMGGKKFKIQPHSKGERLEIAVPLVQPEEFRVYCGEYQTNLALRW